MEVTREELIEKDRSCCENCSHWKQPVTPEHCYADDAHNMGDCTEVSMPIAKATHCGDWCNLHLPAAQEPGQ